MKATIKPTVSQADRDGVLPRVVCNGLTARGGQRRATDCTVTRRPPLTGNLPARPIRPYVNRATVSDESAISGLRSSPCAHVLTNAIACCGHRFTEIAHTEFRRASVMANAKSLPSTLSLSTVVPGRFASV